MMKFSYFVHVSIIIFHGIISFRECFRIYQCAKVVLSTVEMQQNDLNLSILWPIESSYYQWPLINCMFSSQLDIIHSRSITWQLPIAHSKWILFQIGSQFNPLPNHIFTLANHLLNKCNNFLDLDISFDDNLKFSGHIHGIIQRDSQRVKLIHLTFLSKNVASLVGSYTVYIRFLL